MDGSDFYCVAHHDGSSYGHLPITFKSRPLGPGSFSWNISAEDIDLITEPCKLRMHPW
jgi:hypothetical protein